MKKQARVVVIGGGSRDEALMGELADALGATLDIVKGAADHLGPAVLAAAQDKAHDYKLEGAGVAERYFGTASVSPASVFPLLLRLNRHHLNKVGKSDRFGSHERFITEQIQQVLALFKPEQERVRQLPISFQQFCRASE